MENISVSGSVDKSLLGMCMGEMYPDSFVMYREYIQNACDAIEEATLNNIPDTTPAISIKISPINREVVIMDRGIGVPKDKVNKYLIGLGASHKKNNQYLIGRYGIGRLIGAHYCDEIIYETSSYSEPVKSTVRFDAKLAWEIVNSPEDQDCIDVINKVNSGYTEPEKEDEHYFRVILKNVSSDALLDKEKVISYLAETAPVDYSFEFKDDILKPALEGTVYKDLYKNVKKWRISVNDTEVKKLYQPQVKVNKQLEDVGRVGFLDFIIDGERLAWGWFAMSKTAKQMNEVPFMGIRLREHNIAIGVYDHSYDFLSTYFKKQIAYTYFIGEIFITSPKIIPSSERSGLEFSLGKVSFDQLLVEKFSKLKDLYDTTSRFTKNLLEAGEALTKKKIAERQLTKETDEGKQESLKKTIKEQKKVIEDSFSASSKLYTHKMQGQFEHDLVSDAIDLVQSNVDSVLEVHNNKTSVIKSDTKVRSINVRDLVDKEVLKTDEQEPPVDNPGKKPALPPEEKVVKPEKKPSELEPFKNIKLSGYDTMKKVYSVLNSEKKYIPENILEKIKKKLVKRLTDA